MNKTSSSAALVDRNLYLVLEAISILLDQPGQTTDVRIGFGFLSNASAARHFISSHRDEIEGKMTCTLGGWDNDGSRLSLQLLGEEVLICRY